MKRFLSALLLALVAVATPQSADAISDQYRVLIGTGYETRTNFTGDANGTAYCFDSGKPTDFIFWLDIDAVSGTTPTADIRIEHSPDKKNWKTLESFTQVTTSDGIQTFHIPNETTHIQRCLRAVVDLGGTSPVYNILVRAHYRLQ